MQFETKVAVLRFCSIPSHKTFVLIKRHLRETERLKSVRNTGKPQQAPKLIVRTIPELCNDKPGFRKALNQTCRDQLICPFHIQPVQELFPLYHRSHLNFSQIVQEHRILNGCHTNILFTDESCFTCGTDKPTQ